MSSSISDKTLAELSGQSYRKADKVEVPIGNHKEVWVPVDIPKPELLHNPISSFDATVYKNEETKQVVIAFRGSQEGSDFYDADAFDVVTL
ncbi:hypothetical protein [Bacillus sp. XF8]|uniref:hypothetical protein n=1 Tax=Bacillus sp. XF8 TaxID=2819289 RepID=UPI001AA019BA|nr:hypothetical protein [Bacillus sp. XF8]MBO1583187.1 hypothetical protein [Bacillus sp. XF8]